MVTTIAKGNISEGDTMAETASVVHSSLTDSTNSNNKSSHSKSSGKPKEKRRNNEKRKERSRDAARSRRSRESEIFNEMAQELPLTMENINQLDKASVMRIAIAYLKIRDVLTMFPQMQALCNDGIVSQSEHKKASITTTDELVDYLELSSLKDSSNSSGIHDFDFCLLKETLDGFLLVLSQEGDIIYTTDNISDYLGISKIDILGQPIWEFAHQCDHSELKEALNTKRSHANDKGIQKAFTTHHCDAFVRLKCTLTSRGRSINIKSASYKVVHITGHLKVNNKCDRVLVAIGRPIPHPSNIEVPLGSTTFLTKHSLDFKFTYVDEKMFDLMGYMAEDLEGITIFDCHHGNDSETLMRTFKNVLTKGQGETCRYRFLGKYGGYCWLVTQATVVYDKLKPQSVVCVNYVISDLEQKYEIYSLKQYEASQKLKLGKDFKCNINRNKNKNTENIIKTNANENILVKNKNCNEQNINNNNNNEHNDNDGEVADKEYTLKESLEEALVIKSTNLINNKNNHLKNKCYAARADNLIETVTKVNPETQQSPAETQNLATFSSPSLSPTLPLAPLSPPTPITTVTRAIFENKAQPAVTTTNKVNVNANANANAHTTAAALQQFMRNKNNHVPLPSTPKAILKDKFVKEKLPKTVTSSIIRAVPPVAHLPNTTSTSSVLQLQSLNVPTRAQSVTASVFTPFSQFKSLSADRDPKQVGKLFTISAAATVTVLEQQQRKQINQEPQLTAHSTDMNKRYIPFLKDAGLTMLKEEPDDFASHLAPDAVDECLPLEETAPVLFGDMLAGFMDSYNTLLPDDIHPLNSTPLLKSDDNNQSCKNYQHGLSVTASAIEPVYESRNDMRPAAARKDSVILNDSPSGNSNQKGRYNSGQININNNNNNSNMDPFIIYGDESNDTNCSQHLISPNIKLTSPEGSTSIPSLCSPDSFSQENEFTYYTMNVDDMDDLTMRAPYIPMDEQDDLPLLTNDELLWYSSNSFTTEDLNVHTKDSDMQQLQLQQTLSYQQQQLQFNAQQQAQLYSNSLCSSPTSTISSLSPSPSQQQQLQQHNSNAHQPVFTTDSSELAALLGGSGNGTLSILNGPNNIYTSAAGTPINHGGRGVDSSNGTHSSNRVTDVDSIVNGDQELCLQQLQHQLQQQRLRQQHSFSPLNNNCKKETFDAAIMPCRGNSAENTYNNHAFNKNHNLDCWNEFLQSSDNESSTGTASISSLTTTTTHQQKAENAPQLELHLKLLQQQHQQEQQQNLIINTVPLLKIENNTKKILLPLTQRNEQCKIEQHLSKSKSPDIAPTGTVSSLLNPTSLTACGNIIGLIDKTQAQTNGSRTAYTQTNRPTQKQQQEQNRQAQPAILNHKRHMPTTPHNQQRDSKRLKSSIAAAAMITTTTPSTTITTTTTTTCTESIQTNNRKITTTRIIPKTTTLHLINQLHQNNQLQKKHQEQINLPITEEGHINGNCTNNGNNLVGEDMLKWTTNNEKQQQQSDSVLKNLLISGYDEKEPLQANILTIGKSLQDINAETQLTSPMRVLLEKEKYFNQPTTEVLRNYPNNPLIGGPPMLASPNILSTTKDLNPSLGLAAFENMVGTEVGNNMISLKGEFNLKSISARGSAQNGLQIAVDGRMFNTVNNQEMQVKAKTNNESPPLAFISSICSNNTFIDENIALHRTKTGNRKINRSLALDMNNNNSSLPSMLIDFCNDDYHLNTDEFIKESDLVRVFNEWPEELL